MRIVIYRKAKVTSKPTKATRATAERVVELSRFPRPEVNNLFLSGAFHRLPIVPAHVVKNAPLRQLDHWDDGFEVPEDEYGNIGRGEAQAAQSLYIYILRTFVDTGLVDRSEVAVVVDRS